MCDVPDPWSPIIRFVHAAHSAMGGCRGRLPVSGRASGRGWSGGGKGKEDGVDLTASILITRVRHSVNVLQQRIQLKVK